MFVVFLVTKGTCIRHSNHHLSFVLGSGRSLYIQYKGAAGIGQEEKLVLCYKEKTREEQAKV
ncbi:hypothetical protein D7X87_18715 [bacterium D16-54]|nr:hypothetical protein D7X87_18715 [bacterium D16-54]RKJ12576.1 hypothetical protein D7X65_18875 [bacterium D16-56]